MTRIRQTHAHAHTRKSTRTRAQREKEWKIKEAYIITPKGKKICDFSENNLHLVGYSIPFKGEVSFDELNHIFRYQSLFAHS